MNEEYPDVPLELHYNGTNYTGYARPLPESCREGICYELKVFLNQRELGLIQCHRSGWRMPGTIDQEFVNAIGEHIQLWYE